LREIKEKLDEAQAHFQLQTLKGNNSAYTCASNAKKLGDNILQKITDYRQAKSDASSLVQAMHSELQTLKNDRNVSYVRSELLTLQNQVNLADEHFQADTISDYRKAFEISKQVPQMVSELKRLADKRELDGRAKTKKGIGRGIKIGIGGLIVGWVVGAGATGSPGGAIGGIIMGFLVGFMIGFALETAKEE